MLKISQINSINKNLSSNITYNNNAVGQQTTTTPQSYGTPIYSSIPEKSVYDNNVIHTSWLYSNDLHGKMTMMERHYNISKEFDSTPTDKMTPGFYTTTTPVSKFKVCSGDVILGANYVHNQVANNFVNWSGFIAMAAGNHEFDVDKPELLAKLLDDANYKLLAANLEVKKGSPLEGKIEKSMVYEKDGEKYGIIGIAPSDMKERVKMNDTLSCISVQNFDDTMKTVQEEADKFKKQGINKIVLLSHSGANHDKRLAQGLDGVDIIFGAHTHELIQGIKEGENLFYSKSGEPVIITQAGKDGEFAGILNVDFDQNGTIKKAQNNLIKTRSYNRPLFVKDSVENILGKPEVIGKVRKAAPAPKNRLIEPNAHAYLIADAVRSELNTDISIVNAGNIRGSFSVGPIDTRLISDITPFENKMMIVNMSEKQLVDAIKFGCKSSFTKSTNKPGILYLSGIKYTCNKKGDILSMEYTDRNNNVQKIDVNNPSPDKKYTVALDDFIATGGDGYFERNKHPNYVLKQLDVDKNKLTCDYIKKLDQPIEIELDDRIKIVD